MFLEEKKICCFCRIKGENLFILIYNKYIKDIKYFLNKDF